MTKLLLLAVLVASPAAASPPLRFEERRIERKLPGCGDEKEGCVHVELVWVEAVSGPPAARAKINSAILADLLERPSNDPAASPEAYAADLIAIYPRDSLGRWHMFKKIRPLRIAAPVISLECSEDWHSGGLHPSSSTTYLNFDPATGERVTLDRFLKAGSLARLTAIAETHFRRERRVSATADLEQEGFTFKDGRFRLAEDYGFTDTALVFFYNIYEIAPYSMGATKVSIPYAGIRGLFRSEFKLDSAGRANFSNRPEPRPRWS